MADKNLLRTNNSTIEAYRASDAAPDEWVDAKFWLVNELRRIQNGFFSVDDVIAQIGDGTGEVGDTIIQNVTSNIIQDGASLAEILNSPQFNAIINNIETTPGPEGPQGPEGAQGPAGQDGNAGDLIADYKTALDFTWSSEKIAEELAKVGVGGDNSITIGATPPVNPSTGDLWFDNTFTLELYVWDGSVWVSTTGAGGAGGGDESLTNPNFTYTSGLLTRVDYDGGAYKTLTYNADGQLTSTFDGSITKTLTYNADGTLASVSET